MESIFGTMKDFQEGKVFEVTPGIGEYRRGIRMTRAKRRIVPMTRFPRIGTAIFTAAAFSLTLTTASLTLSASASKWVVPAPIVSAAVESLPDRFFSARKFLGLSQSEAARLLHVSKSAIEKFEQRQIATPSPNFQERYSALIALSKLYRDAFNGNRELIDVYLRHPGQFFGGKSALEYAAQRDQRAIFDILSAQSRMLT